ncbi:hypothetical protein PoB_006204700 [Plakobranchus ocellatus]|uniref:Uncharacterized protein n=1 Tax=Plakobranchus ocellatus TaxID=259542 RepID=A0AAV4CUF1_9GAST|nr:hypothetical protein PoB_006204700 [Plakobranchus ocellatus]
MSKQLHCFGKNGIFRTLSRKSKTVSLKEIRQREMEVLDTLRSIVTDAGSMVKTGCIERDEAEEKVLDTLRSIVTDAGSMVKTGCIERDEAEEKVLDTLRSIVTDAGSMVEDRMYREG